MKKALRESRHLWVGNLPENIREEEIQEYFSRYGRVEKVKLLIKTSPDGAKAAFVDFVDIRSATKANEAQNRIGDRDLRTNFNEPGANKNHQYQRMHGGYPGGVDYRQPVVIYAAPPSNVMRSSYGTVYQKNDRYQQQYPSRSRGRSPGSRGGYGSSDSDRSPSPNRRSRISPDDSSDSDSSSSRSRCTVLVKYLPGRCSEATLEEALYHEFRKCGEIFGIRIKGSGSDRYAYIRFGSMDEAERATDFSYRTIMGQKAKVTLKARAKRSSRMDDIEFDPHATRTIFIGNVEKTLMHGELKAIFQKFGDVVYVDIKKMPTGTVTYAFLQYIDIHSAMLAKRKMDRKYIGSQRIKVGYGRATPTNSLWVGNLSKDVMEHQVSKAFHPYGYVQRCLIDTYYWQALVRFETIEACTKAFAEMHGKPFMGKRLSVDFASPQCRDGFYSRMEKRGLLDRRQLETSPTPPDVHVNFQNVVRGGAFQARGYNITSSNMTQSDEPNNYKGRDYDDNRPYDRYNDRPGFDYDKELRDYYGRDRRYRKDYSPMSRGSSSPPRRRYSRDSVSPDSIASSKKLRSKVEKKKRRRSVDSSPSEEPVFKKEKKKKKDKKAKKLKAGKGTIDLGYDMNDDDEFSGNEPKSKADIKKEKKERKKAEKAEKARKKAEKKQKKLDKLQAKLSKIEAAVERYEPKMMEDGKTEDKNQEKDESVPDDSSANDTIEMDPEIKEIVKSKTEEISESDGFSEEPSEKSKPPESEGKDGSIKEKSPSPEKTTQNEVSNVKQVPPSKGGDSSDSSSSSSSDSDDSDDSSDDDRDYKHRSQKEREAVTRKETERRDAREPKAYRQDREPYRRERTPEKYREREFNKNSYSDGRRSPGSGYGSGRRPHSPSANRNSGRSKSPSSRGRSGSRSPYTKRESNYEKRKSSPARRSPRPYDRESRNARTKRSRSPPPPPPPNDRKTPISNQTSNSGQNADTLLDLLRRFPVMWQGLLGLKNDTAAVQMHFLSGNVQLAENSLPRAVPPEVPPPLRISQRMKLETSQLDGVDKRIQNPKEHCMLLALPCGRDPLDVHAQTRALKTGFITYLQQKQAAGIVNISNAERQVSFVVHIFPPCEFAQAHVTRVGPDLLDSAAHSGHLMILITPA